MKMRVDIWGWILSCVLFVVIAAMLLFNKCGGKEVEVVRDTVTTVEYLPGDKVPYEVVHKVPGPKEVVYIEVPTNTDTSAVLKDYLAKFFIPDSLMVDSIWVYINDTVHKNRIYSRSIKIKHLVGPKVITRTITKEVTGPVKNKLYLGLNTGYTHNWDQNIPKQVHIGPGAVFTTKKHAYGYSYDILNNGHQVQLLWLISFKK